MASKSKIKNNDPKATPKARAQRLQRARKMTNLSTRAIDEKYDFLNAVTFQGWEAARHGGLSEKGAKKVTKMLVSESVHCSIEWLLYEIGTGPKFIDNNSVDSTPTLSPEEQDSAIIEELQLFRQHLGATAEFIVEDDGMTPRFIPGEYVAGVKYTGDDIQKSVGYDCIVQTSDGKILLRHVRDEPDQTTHHLTCTNPKTTVNELSLNDVTLTYAAPVIWQRRKLEPEE